MLKQPPSKEETYELPALTARLASAGTLLGVPLLDHIIAGDECYFSFREAGRLPS